MTTLGGGVAPARAQSVDEAEDAAQQAEQQAEVATGLVDEAVAQRAGIEAELATTMARINELADELSRVSAGVERLKEQVGFADAELVGVQEDIETGAVDAYMTALSSPGVNFVNSDDVEDVMVTGLFVADVISAGRQQVDQLIVKRDDLEDLIATFQAEQARVDELKDQVDTEVENLAALYEEADAAVAQAIRDADRSAAEYSEALSAVDSARAREAEQERQEERGPAGHHCSRHQRRPDHHYLDEAHHDHDRGPGWWRWGRWQSRLPRRRGAMARRGERLLPVVPGRRGPGRPSV